MSARQLPVLVNWFSVPNEILGPPTLLLATRFSFFLQRKRKLLTRQIKPGFEQFVPYNTALRQWPQAEYEAMVAADNRFATTIYVLVSAVQKIARNQRLSEGLRLYRGLGGLMDLPESFLRAETARGGVRGFTEWGFMSTTSEKSVAIRYSGITEGRRSAMVLEIEIGAVDRGACISFFSQYPQEAEYLWLPCSFMAPYGHVRLETAAAGVVRVVPVRANANLTAGTLEELVAQKKRTHLAAFRFLVSEVRTDLRRIAEEGGAAARLSSDISRTELKPEGTVEALIDRVHSQCDDMLRKHDEHPPEDYTKDSVYRSLVTEALDAKACAISKFRLWLEDERQFIADIIDRPLRTSHRDLIASLKRALAALPINDRHARRAAALGLCKLRGVVEESVDETNEAGEDVLTRAAADGLGGTDFKMMLVAAGIDFDRVVSLFQTEGTVVNSSFSRASRCAI